MSQSLTTGFVTREMRRRGYHVIAGPDTPVRGGAADSRVVRPGDLFTAFPGENTDGNLYVGEALARGAVAIICERAPEGEWPGCTIVVAPDATRAVGELAAAWRIACAPRVVGITGTVGKTTAKELTACVLSARFRTHRSEGNLNSREGLPLALLTLRRDDEVSVLEMGMDSVGEIARLCAIARPDLGVVLNIGLTHLSKLGNVEAIATEKLSLPRSLSPNGTAVLNADDPRLAEAAPPLGCHVLTFGGAEGASLRRGPVEMRGLQGTRFALSWQGRHAEVHCPLPGEHVVAGALAAIGSALTLGMGLDEATMALGNASVEGRLRTIRTAS
ncbi:MAG: UDP-N-acetylmuramoyl-tripeptide--D-alanyl-D-alanine ligase, partial [Dehalococcoidia bacterium]|nr:UDP-N-acetylmuramoyl-tripeptide--D-alanyl-D-alanine ligase [Dehalococcoidia bacterium]